MLPTGFLDAAKPSERASGRISTHENDQNRVGEHLVQADTFGLTRKPFLISPDPDARHFRNPNIDKARNDILRHDDIIKDLCESTGVEFIPHPIPEENIEESQGECE